jgi:hypothetical protein
LEAGLGDETGISGQQEAREGKEKENRIKHHGVNSVEKGFMDLTAKSVVCSRKRSRRKEAVRNESPNPGLTISDSGLGFSP